MARIFVTGGAGFIGSNFIRYVLGARADLEVVNFDGLTYAGNLENLADLEGNPRYRFVRGDVSDAAAVGPAMEGIDAVLNFAAESHVDRSLEDPLLFVRSNVLGTQVLLDAARARKVRRFLQISTDEVYGTLGASGRFTEGTPLAPNSPYAASKAAADLLVLAAHASHGADVVITRCCNNYGPYQFPEKLIPLFVTNAMADQPLPVYGDGRQVRDWIHVDDHSRAVLAVLERGRAGRVYNVGADSEWTNLDITRRILRETEKPETLMRHVQDRPGHDRRYAIDAGRLRGELGWRPEVPFDRGLRDTVRWYRENRSWWERVRSGAYRDYYERQYGRRLREGGGA